MRLSVFMFYNYIVFFPFLEEKMLHVEVHVTWSRLAGLLTYPPVLTELDDTNNVHLGIQTENVCFTLV